MPAIMVARSVPTGCFRKKAQYKKCGSPPFVSDTCALIAGCIRKYRKCGIYRNDAIRCSNRITVLIGQTRDRGFCALIL